MAFPQILSKRLIAIISTFYYFVRRHFTWSIHRLSLFVYHSQSVSTVAVLKDYRVLTSGTELHCLDGASILEGG